MRAPSRMNDVISRVIARLFMAGERPTSADVVRLVLDEAPEVLDDDTKQKLAIQGMQNKARALMKKSVASEALRVVDPTGDLFDSIELPAGIALKNAPGERGMLWASTMKSRTVELQEYADYLARINRMGLAKERRVRGALEAVRHVSDDDDTTATIEEILAEARRAKGH